MLRFDYGRDSWYQLDARRNIEPIRGHDRARGIDDQLRGYEEESLEEYTAKFIERQRWFKKQQQRRNRERAEMERLFADFKEAVHDYYKEKEMKAEKERKEHPRMVQKPICLKEPIRRESRVPDIHEEPIKRRPRHKPKVRIRCPTCQGWGHVASQCPNEQIFVLLDNGEIVPAKEVVEPITEEKKEKSELQLEKREDGKDDAQALPSIDIVENALNIKASVEENEPRSVQEVENCSAQDNEESKLECESSLIVESNTDCVPSLIEESTIECLPSLEVMNIEEHIDQEEETLQIENKVKIEQEIEVQEKDVSTMIAKVPMDYRDIDVKEARRKEFLELLSRRYIQKEEFLEFLPSLKGLTIEVPDLRTNPFQERENDMNPRGSFIYTLQESIEPSSRHQAKQIKKTTHQITQVSWSEFNSKLIDQVPKSSIELISCIQDMGESLVFKKATKVIHSHIKKMCELPGVDVWMDKLSWSEILVQEGFQIGREWTAAKRVKMKLFLAKRGLLKCWISPKDWRIAWEDEILGETFGQPSFNMGSSSTRWAARGRWVARRISQELGVFGS